MSIGLLALLDDISMLADDAVTMTKVSMQKTAGILGDDLAVNAKQASGYSASREIPVLIRITKGALLNKLIILPFAFLLTAFASGIIPYILIFGGIYLAFEGVEKIHEFLEEKLKHKTHKENKNKIELTENQKVKSAIITDFILSIEIILVALSTVLDKSLTMQIIIVSLVAITATFFVYGIVAFIVRLDDIGFFIQKKFSKNKLLNNFGKFLVLSLPVIIKILSVVGTWAMLVVAGGLFTHNIKFLHHFYEKINYIPSIIFDTILGFAVGYIFVIGFLFFEKLKK